MVKRKKGFTLIELIAVLVIMAIIALIVTPLVMSIIRKARISADRRSIDAYGRSIELAIAGYLLDTGTFPTSISQLTIEYSGDEVVCSTTQLKSDSSIYLAGCTVDGRSVDGYTYGKEETTPTSQAYNIGDQVTYNGVDYYVFKDSSVSEESVILLKAEFLTGDEVNRYGAGHVNRYTPYSQGTAYVNDYGYGSIAYYSSETCGWVNNNLVTDGCKNDYASSDIKYVVDAWKADQAPSASEARLITIDELIENFNYDDSSIDYGSIFAPEEIPDWLYPASQYWTMSPGNGAHRTAVYTLDDSIAAPSGVYYGTEYDLTGLVRPVITISKSYVSPKGN